MKKNRAKNIIMIVIGIIMIIAALAAYRLNYFPAGGALIGCGMVLLINGVMRMGSSKAAHEAEIIENDERNIALDNKASAVSLYAIVPALAICCIVFAQMKNFMVSGVFCGILLLWIIVYLVAKAVLNKKM